MSSALKVEIGELTTTTATMSRDRRRPKRQRVATTLYTDDNPSTFTTKNRKGDGFEPDLKPPKPSFYFVEEDILESSTKRPYRRRKPYHKDDMLETTTVEKLASSQERQMTEDPAASAAVDAPPAKRKRGRPPKNKNFKPVVVPAPAVASSSASAPMSAPLVSTTTTSTISLETRGDEAPPSPPRKAADAPSSPQVSRAVKSPKRGGKVSSKTESSPPPPLNDLEGSFLNHAVRLAPILPPVLEDSPVNGSGNHSKSQQQQQQLSYAQALTGLGKATPLESPQWAPLYQPNVFFEEDYDADTNRLPEDLAPVTRSITCITIRKPDQKYMAVGDSMGFCTIYSLESVLRPVARLETVACQQRAREEQEKIRDQQRRKRKSLVVDTSQTTIHALGMIGDRVVLATACELECMDVPSQTSLWVCPLAQDRMVTSLDMHPSRYDVLVSCSLFDNAATLGQSSPLMLLQHSQNNVEVCDANAPILLRSPCCTAIWDNSKNVENRLLFVAVANEELELVLVQGGSIDNWKVACKTRIPVRQSNHFTSLSQSPEGTYTLVACSRGIRLYQTETLQLIHVYGDQLALHGQSIVWKYCLMLGKRLPRKFRKSHDASGNVECDDWLQEDEAVVEKESNDNNHKHDSDLGQYVVGVPHYKGPKELTETLHVWRVEQASVVPAISMPLPPKSEGVQALVAAPQTNGDRLVLATRDGNAHVLRPRMVSNFAGIMYPPGYHVITDSVDYMEEEGELDQVVESPTPAAELEAGDANDDNDDEESVDVDVLLGDEMDQDIREAMRQSLLEQKLEKKRRREALKDRDVDVVYPLRDDDHSATTPTLIPCRPEVYLRQAVNAYVEEEDEEEVQVEHHKLQNDEGPATSPSKALKPAANDPKLFVSTILESLGHTNPKKHEGGGDFSFSVTAKVVIASAPSAAVVVNRGSAASRHGKKSRAASLEALIKSSVDPRLQRFMFSKQACGADGKGSSLAPTKPSKLPKHVTSSSEGDESAAATAEEDDEDNVGSAIMGKEENGFAAPKLDALQTKMRQDEAAVALGLLVLSPNHGRVQTPETDPGSDTASRTSSQNNHALSHNNSSSSKAYSDRDWSEFVPETKKEPKMDPNCCACRGRLVIHSCGKRALPIDFDEMAKVEREKREKEEEAKRMKRAERRRQADQRRREARKQKQRESEEKLQREERELRLETERLRCLEEVNIAAFAGAAAAASPAPPSAADVERRRREMIVASYASHMSHAGTTVAAPQPTLGLNSVDYNHGSYSVEKGPATSPPTTHWERVGTAPATAAASREVADAVSAYATATGHPSMTLPSGSTSMAKLSSADALVALASFAGIKADQQREQNGQAGFSAFDRPSTAAATHGFSAALPKRSIPSFATIRGQVNGQESSAAPNNHATSSAFLHKPLAPDTAGAAGSATTTTFMWPPWERDVAGVKWPPSSSS